MTAPFSKTLEALVRCRPPRTARREDDACRRRLLPEVLGEPVTPSIALPLVAFAKSPAGR